MSTNWKRRVSRPVPYDGGFAPQDRPDCRDSGADGRQKSTRRFSRKSARTYVTGLTGATIEEWTKERRTSAPMIISTTRPTPKSNRVFEAIENACLRPQPKTVGALFNLVGEKRARPRLRAVGRGLRSLCSRYAARLRSDSDSDSGRTEGRERSRHGSNNPFDPANQRFETHEDRLKENRKVHQGVWLDCLGSGRCQIRR